LRDERRLKRVLTFIKEPDKISAVKQQLDEALRLFHVRVVLMTNSSMFSLLPKLSATMMAGRDIAKVLEGVDIEKVLQRVVDKFNDNIGMHPSQSNVNSHSPYCSIQDHAQCRIGQSPIR
jgi:hypothetical protein